jgi:WD40 repeat protein
VWDVTTGIPVVPALVHPPGQSRDDDVQMVSFSPSGRRLLTVGGDRFARVFDVGTGERIFALDHGAGAQVNVARFSHDGRLIASGGASAVVRVWDARTGAPIEPLEGTGRIADLAFSLDDKLLATAGGNDTLARVWKLAGGSGTAAVTVHRSGVTSVTFTRDAAGTSVMTTGRDGNAFINLSNSGFPQAALLGHRAAITTAAFTPDNQIAATASADGSVRLWDASVDNSGPRPAAVMTDVRSDPPSLATGRSRRPPSAE